MSQSVEKDNLLSTTRKYIDYESLYQYLNPYTS